MKLKKKQAMEQCGLCDSHLNILKSIIYRIHCMFVNHFLKDINYDMWLPMVRALGGLW